MNDYGNQHELSLGSLLFGRDAKVSDSLRVLLDEHEVIDLQDRRFSKLTAITARALVGIVAEASQHLFDVDLIALMFTGWRKYSALVDAAERTLGPPGDSELVQVAAFDVTLDAGPYVDLFIDDRVVGTVEFDVSVEFAIQALVATVERGKLTALHSGACDITGSLSSKSIQLAHEHKRVELPMVVHLAEGIPLLPEPFIRIDEETQTRVDLT